MDDTLHIPLTPFQVARFAQLKVELDGLAERKVALEARHSEGVTVAIGAQCDPMTVSGWDIRIVEAEIVCTPPPSKPELVKEA